MASSSPLGLPSISPQLKSIVPYLQRAQEVRKQDPIVAYWCAYYAAQLGISLKAKDSASRDVLFALLGTLERMKKEIGPNEAVDNESVSSAYVENFALKVFATADNEDRLHNATRSTAKKFLAAAHFLEVLKTFSQSEIAEATSDKIKYAKWKAADIAKAFREGRQPIPGPAGSDLQQGLATIPPASPHPQEKPTELLFQPSTSSQHAPYNERSSPPIVDHHTFTTEPQTPPRHLEPHWDGNEEGYERHARSGGDEEVLGNWSTVATPGTAPGHAAEWDDETSPSNVALESGGHKRSSWSGSSTLPEAPEPPTAWVSVEPDNPQYGNGQGHGAAQDVAGTTDEHGSRKSVHFAPSISDPLGLSTSGPYDDLHEQEGSRYNWPAAASTPYETDLPPPPQRPDTVDMNLPPRFVPDSHQVWPDENSNALYTDFPPQILAPAPTRDIHQRYAQRYHPNSPPPPLTPTLIAKVQRHCRFAISALDYEDAEQAKKDLRAALALLGG